MRNNILILIVLLALTACNFPLSKTQATPDVVGTRVAQAKTQTATAASVPQQTQQAAEEHNGFAPAAMWPSWLPQCAGQLVAGVR